MREKHGREKYQMDLDYFNSQLLYYNGMAQREGDYPLQQYSSAKPTQPRARKNYTEQDIINMFKGVK